LARRDTAKLALLCCWGTIPFGGFAAREMLIEVRDETASIADTAREVEISPYHLIRQFESVFGLTPHQFRISCRLDRAKPLLAKGQHRVTEVCMEVGFSSLGSFSDLFTRRVGEPPSAYTSAIKTRRASAPAPHQSG
jgi:AraC-like DNA-binding protein